MFLRNEKTRCSWKNPKVVPGLLALCGDVPQALLTASPAFYPILLFFPQRSSDMTKNSWEKCSFGQNMQKEMGVSALCAQENQQHGLMTPFSCISKKTAVMLKLALDD